MRIRRPSASAQPSSRPAPRKRRPPRQGEPVLLVVLGLALLVGSGLWYQQEGRQVIAAFFPGSPPVIRVTPEATSRSSDLSTLRLDIAPPDYQAMQAQRDEALEKGDLQLDDERWVQARIQLEGATMTVETRLSESWIDPLQERKWPFDVRIGDESQAAGAATLLQGMRSFSLRSPATSWYLNEWLYMEDLRQAGILAPRVYLVNVSVNGEDWGIYTLEEGISPQLPLSQGRPAGPVIHVDESTFWEQQAGSGEGQEAGVAPERAALAQVEALAGTSQDGPAQAEQQAAAVAQWRAFQNHRLPASQVFDAEQMGRYLAHANLWGMHSGPQWPDEWFYFNPSTSRLEPIAYRALSPSPVDAPRADLSQYDDLAVMEAYAREVARIAQPEYLSAFRSAYADEFERRYVTLAQEFTSMELEAPWMRLPERQEWLLRSLHPAQTVYAYQAGGELDSAVDLQVCNLLGYPVALEKLRAGGREIEIRADWIVPSSPQEQSDALVHAEARPAVVLRGTQGYVPGYVTLRIPSAVLQVLASQRSAPSGLQIVTRLVGVEEQVVVDVQADSTALLPGTLLPTQLPAEDVLARHPFLRLSDQPGFLEIQPGSWPVDGDLVLPDGFGLRATGPVTLTFDREAVLFATGPLLFDGQEQGAVRLVVVRADPGMPSVLRNVEIGRTGALTFYESPVVLDHCRVRESLAPVALHVVGSWFELLNTAFEGAAGHAVATDRSQGRIEQCTFYDVRGDGIDLRGSQADVQNVVMAHVYGQGIAAREGSVARVSQLRATDTNVAVASRDRSTASVRGAYVARAWTAGLAAYQERLAPGMASIRASDLVWGDDSVPALVQEGSSAVIDRAAVAAQALSLHELYYWSNTLAGIHELNDRLGPEIRLLGYKLAQPEPGSGDPLTLTLYWQPLARLDRDYTIFVHILDPSGETATGWDNMPCQDTCPTAQWPAGRLVEDAHLVPLPPGLPAGEYRVALGVYYLPTGERLPVYGPDGQEIPDGRIVLEEVIRLG
jgi:hypothetical protein